MLWASEANWRVLVVGMVTGLASGLFGKGGSAMATTMLQLSGVPAMFAVASPLPAAIPSTLAASLAYARSRLLVPQVLAVTVAAGVPATLLGAWSSHWLGGKPLLLLSNSLVAGLGVATLLQVHREPEPPPQPLGARTLLGRAVLVGVGVGYLSGLLANSGGVLLAPLFVRVLRLPLKAAFATSLLASTALALPGTLVHVQLGHVSWPVVALFAAGSIPLSYLGARLAIRMRVAVLEPLFGVALLIMGAVGGWAAWTGPA
ncbi:MAG: sulfite exporter TauE/SafE family protein [Deltaproteobacteria bacterium]|nr:sulfite exporter TauE/SafE family protein [Deltaproteobacteria bacterium]